MNQSSDKQIVMLPSDFERQQIFYWLKRVSSVTAWRRILGFYENWANSVEDSLRVADDRGWGNETSLPQTEYALVLKCLAHCKEGVNRLGQGDKRVFKFDANGEFVMALRMLTHWSQMLERIELGENGINKHTPLWPQFCETLMATASAWGECGPHILEPRYLDAPARSIYGVWMKNAVKLMPFPDNLPTVPNPLENIFIRTNKPIPYSGIWEPIIDASASKSPLLSLFSSVPKPQPPFKIAGSMNYLHGGSSAPKITIETASGSTDIDTTWRLLWKDRRYEDGTIPDEEAYYGFSQPDDIQIKRPRV